jgi:hypothetical protein
MIGVVQDLIADGADLGASMGNMCSPVVQVPPCLNTCLPSVALGGDSIFLCEGRGLDH